MKEAEYERAIAAFGEALKLDPSDVLAHIGRGDGFRQLRKFDEAINDLDEAIRKSTASRRTLSRIAVAVTSKRANAIALLRTGLRQFSSTRTIKALITRADSSFMLPATMTARLPISMRSFASFQVRARI